MQPEQLSNIELRDALINASREELIQWAELYQDEIIKALNSKWLPKLHYLVGGDVNTSAANYAKIQEIDKIVKTITSKQGDALLVWFLDKIEKIGELAADYFKSLDAEINIKTTTATAVKNLLNSIGYDGKAFAESSFLFDLVQIPSPVRKIKAQAFQAIARGYSFEDFKNMFRITINGQGRGGLVETHMRTAAYDAFQQADRHIHNNIAVKLKLDNALYAGTVMKTSRAFCKSKVGKYFTRKEIMAWANQEWEGKSTPYDPLVDCGGYNCTHILSWVTKKQYDEQKSP